MSEDLLNGRKLTTDDAAAYLGISASTLNKLRMAEGGPRFIKYVGHRVVYDLADLDAWANAQKRTSNAARIPEHQAA